MLDKVPAAGAAEGCAMISRDLLSAFVHNHHVGACGLARGVSLYPQFWSPVVEISLPITVCDYSRKTRDSLASIEMLGGGGLPKRPWQGRQKGIL